MSNNNIEYDTEFLLVNKKTGEVITEIDENVTIISKKKTEAFNKIKRRAGREFTTLRTLEENRKLILSLNEYEAGLLFVFSCYTDYNGFVCYKGHKNYIPMSTSEIRAEFSIPKVRFYKGLDGLLEKNVVKKCSTKEMIDSGYSLGDSDGTSNFLQINKNIAFRGSWKENGISEHNEQVRLYSDVVTTLLKEEKLSYKASGLLLKMGLFLHKDYNVLVRNPEEDNLNLLDFITIRELKTMLGITSGAINNLLGVIGDFTGNSVVISLTGELLYSKVKSGKRKKVSILFVNPDVLTRRVGEYKPLDEILCQL